MRDFIRAVYQDVKSVIEYTFYLVTILLSMAVVAWLLYGSVSLIVGGLVR